MHEEFRKILDGYRLTTAEILYRLPDHPAILQSYLWQDYDLLPEFPILHDFLHFWERRLDGKLYSVKIASCDTVSPSDWQRIKKEISIH